MEFESLPDIIAYARRNDGELPTQIKIIADPDLVTRVMANVPENHPTDVVDFAKPNNLCK